MVDTPIMTEQQIATVSTLTKGKEGKIELVDHSPSTTVELYIDPVAPDTTAFRYHISADGTYDTESCQVPTDDGDWDWEFTDDPDNPDPCPESPDGRHQVTSGSCDQCGAKNFS